MRILLVEDDHPLAQGLKKRFTMRALRLTG